MESNGGYALVLTSKQKALAGLVALLSAALATYTVIRMSAGGSPRVDEVRVDQLANPAGASSSPASGKESGRRTGGDDQRRIAESAFRGETGLSYPVQNLSRELPRLSSMAEKGDLVAARTAYRALGLCKTTYRSLARLRQIRDSETADSMRRADVERDYEYNQALYERCGDLTDGDFARRRDFVSQLAQAGDSEAILEYPFSAKPTDFDSPDFSDKQKDFEEKATGYLNSEIDKGDAKALRSMALAYMPPVVQGGSVAFRDDPYLAYEYMYAYGLSLDDGQAKEALAATLARLEAQLGSGDVEGARGKAEGIFDKCCRR